MNIAINANEKVIALAIPRPMICRSSWTTNS